MTLQMGQKYQKYSKEFRESALRRLALAPNVAQLCRDGVAALSTSVFEISGRHYINARSEAEKRNAMIVAGVGTFALEVWGLLRGHEIQFAAGLAGNPLGNFLADHPILTSIFFIFITLATPIVGAVALLYGW